MLEKLKALILAARQGDWKGAVKIILGLLADGVDLLPNERPVPVNAYDDPLVELEGLVACTEPAAQAGGELFKRILPLLMELLRKYLGF